MPTIFRLEGEHLYLDCDEAALHGLSRPFAQADARRCEAWGKGYRDLISKTTLSEAESAPALLALGRQLRDWLDGDGGWLGRVRPRLAATGPWVVEFTAALPLTAPAKAFIDTPWELVADEQGHWAGDLSVRYSPARRLGGRSTPAAPSEYRLSLVFMAAAPRSQSVLDYEAEEAAILDATGAFGGRAKLDLVVEESGNLGLLADCVAREAPVDVLHLSCHGHSEPTPVLLLESGEGNDEPVGTGNLISALTGNLPRLLFLSACHSARGGAVVDSLAASLLAAGMPAVLGWDGAVRDHEATEFAAVLYRTLSRKAALTEAVANARFELLAQPRTAASPTRDSAQPLRAAARDWHLARLFLGPNGGGPLTAGERRHAGRSRADAGHKEFLDEKGQAVPVAGRREFVGRRRQIQAILREFRGGDCAGVLIHGMGQQGKSSLAARIANRLDHHATAVVYGRYGPADVLEALRRAVGGAEVSAIVERDPERRNDPADFAVRLRELLEGPCCEAVDTQHRPVLLVLDDLERILERRETGLPRVEAAHQAVLGAVIETFANADTDSRLLITSRYRFTLPDQRGRDLTERLCDIPLPPMDETESRKQAGRKVLAREAPPPAEERIERCIQAACGNPGLQDRLFALAAEDSGACDQALAAMERFLQDNVEPDQEQVREFLDNLIIEDLLGLLATGERELLRLSTGFQLPVPWAVFQVLARELALEAGDPTGQRLLALGLWDAFEDAVDSRAVAVAVNALVGPCLGAVSEDEAAVVAKLALSPLFRGWGGVAGQRPVILDAELARLAVLARRAEVLRVTAENGLAWLKGEFRYIEAAELARRAVQILDEHQESASLGLLRTAGECAHQVGEAGEAGTYYKRALKILETAPAPKTPAEIEDCAILLGVYGRLLQSTGELDEALGYFDKAKALFATDDRFQREQIVVQGDIADILQARGKLDEALRIRQEEQLPVYERLGDVRSRAVTMGKIADILQSRGELEEALRIRQEEQLPVYERLGDVRERAVTMGQIADILQSRGELEEALRIRQEEEIPVYERLGDVRSRAVTMGKIADILQSRGELEEALRIRQEEEIPVYERLGDVRERAVTMGKIADILQSRGELEEALRIRQEEQLPVYERLGDVRSRAVTMGQIADILQSRGELEEALRIRQEEEIPVYERLGDVRSRAVTMGQIADILQSRGELEEALRIRQEEEIPVYERLGDVRERAVTMGKIADILQSRGELEEALRIRQEEQLPVYERLGDVRSRAVTMGQIADILQSRGELEEALRIRQEEEIPVYERLGDVRSRAVTLFKIARINRHQGDHQGAFEHLSESYEINLRLGDLEGIIYAGIDLGQLLCGAGYKEEGIPILNRSREGLLKLGRTNAADQLQALLDALDGDQSGRASE